MLTAYKKLFSLLDRRERRRGAIVFAVLILVALVEMLGVASIMPFIAMLSNPEVVETNPYLSYIYESLGFGERSDFLFFLGLVFFALLIGSLMLKAVGLWAQLRFSQNRNYAWSARLIRGYLNQPYEWFLNRHSADLGTSILAEVAQVVNGVLFPAMQVIAQSLVAILLMALLVSVDPLLAAAMGLGLGGTYFAISAVLRRRLRRLGAERRVANHARFHVVQEAFTGIKEVKIGGLEEVLVDRFVRPAQTVASRNISAQLYGQLPSFAMQGLLFGGMLLVLLYLMAERGGFQDALPVIALYAFGGYRLMPALQNIYQGIAQIRVTEAPLNALCEDFRTLQTDRKEPGSRDKAGGTADRPWRLELDDRLELDAVSYSYPSASRPALDGVNITVPARTMVGLVGATGSGKTSCVDIMLGLLVPTEGTLRVDGVPIEGDTVRNWQRSLGYVPQQIFLSDDTVAGNIAFGLPKHRIDLAAVERAAKVANLHEFVMSELPDGYRTKVGERGVRLSGGQRQRIGIARALYHDPSVLILDEATSALDNLTEQAVMEAVRNLGSRKTVIMIAHRLTTVENCDRIFLLERGRVVESGTYDELVARNEQFRAMAGA